MGFEYQIQLTRNRLNELVPAFEHNGFQVKLCDGRVDIRFPADDSHNNTSSWPDASLEWDEDLEAIVLVLHQGVSPHAARLLETIATSACQGDETVVIQEL